VAAITERPFDLISDVLRLKRRRSGHAERCPICSGSGEIREIPKYQFEHVPRHQRKACHGCNGRGWVTVLD